MARWTLDTPPDWVTEEKCVMTDAGWTGVTTGEVYVAISNGLSKSGAADVNAVAFALSTQVVGTPLSVTAYFNEKVTVTAGASIVVTATSGGNITLYAAAGQTGTNAVVFNKQNDNTTNQNCPSSVPSATGTLTGDGTNISDGDTVTIGARTYTFQESLTNVDGNVKRGASAAASLTNLFNAINGTGGVSGTDYAAATTAHPTVTATNPTGTTVVVTAKVAGSAANAIVTTRASGGTPHVAWGAGTLAGGAEITLSIGAQTIGGTIVDTNSAVAATGTLTLTDQPGDTETVVINGKTYTFKTTLTNTDGYVKIGATAADSLANLISAINLTGVAGTHYAAATTLNADVTASDLDGNPLNAVLKAKVAGTGGNSITTTETLTNGSFGGATLSGGVANVASTKTVSAGVAAAAGTDVITAV